jgi:hypothetical protein
MGLPWLKVNVKFSQQRASVYVRLSKNWEKLPVAGNLAEAVRILGGEDVVAEAEPNAEDAGTSWLTRPDMEKIRHALVHAGKREPPPFPFTSDCDNLADAEMVIQLATHRGFLSDMQRVCDMMDVMDSNAIEHPRAVASDN